MVGGALRQVKQGAWSLLQNRIKRQRKFIHDFVNMRFLKDKGGRQQDVIAVLPI
ncbi:MAG: hypothetical protein ACI92Z_002394, partial [Paracoccaceae bacterium]